MWNSYNTLTKIQISFQKATSLNTQKEPTLTMGPLNLTYSHHNLYSIYFLRFSVIPNSFLKRHINFAVPVLLPCEQVRCLWIQLTFFLISSSVSSVLYCTFGSRNKQLYICLSFASGSMQLQQVAYILFRHVFTTTNSVYHSINITDY